MDDTGSQVQKIGAVSSLEVFADAADLMTKDPFSVSRLDSANSVWLTELVDGSKAIFKYFRRNFPNIDHFNTERLISNSNPNSNALAKIILSDQNKQLIVFEYINQVGLTNFAIRSLLENTIGEIENLTLEEQIQNRCPSFLDSWLDVQFSFGPAENIILATARKCETIADSISRLICEWKNESLLHGDLKLSNYLFTKSGFLIIDWETVCFGPVEWDKAGLLQSVILEIISKGPQNEWATTQTSEVIAILANANQKLIDAMVARLVQSSMEATQTSLRIPVSAANFLQAAEFISIGNFDFLDKL